MLALLAGLALTLAAASPAWPRNEPALGGHVHELAAARDLPPAFGALRLWDSGTAWRRLEPRPGEWDFDRLDALVALAGASQRRLLLTLGSTPAWASSRPREPCAYGHGCAAPPARLQDWIHYVDVVSRRYRGRIECYEIWNEVRFHHGEDPADPGGTPMFYSGTLAELLDLTRAAVGVIRRNDPDACVLSPSFHNASPNWIRNLERFLDQGGRNAVDGVSFHFYGQTPERTQGALQAVRRTMIARGLGDRPLWNTEFGFDRPRFAEGPDAADRTIDRLAALVARSVILAASENVARSYWYAFDNRKMGIFHAERDALPRFSRAIAELNRTLAGLRFERCGPAAGQLWQCAVSRAEAAGTTASPEPAPSLVVWSAAADFGTACIERRRLSTGPLTQRAVMPALAGPSAGPRSGADVPSTEPLCVGAAPLLLYPSHPSDRFVSP